MLLPNLGQLTDALQHIGHMTQGVFDVLGGHIAGLCESAEGGHIGKIAIAKLAHIIANRLCLHNIPCRLQNIGGQPQTGGKIVGRSGRNIANGHVRAAAQQAGNGFIEGTVTAAADHQIHTGSRISDNICGVCLSAGDMGDHLIARPVEDIDDLRQIPGCPPHTGAGIHHKQHFLHHSNPLISKNITHIIPWLEKMARAPLHNSHFFYRCRHCHFLSSCYNVEAKE